MTEVLVDLDDVALTYRRGAVIVDAVRGVTRQIVAGRPTVLVGPSGSGKSSLLHLIAALETPTRGRVNWPGIGGAPRIDPTAVGVLFQAPSLVPELDVVQNVAVPLLLRGVPLPEATTRALAALGELGLLDLHGALPEQLSGGQAQRVALARALVPEPKVLVADEPTGQLDRATAELVIALLLEDAGRRGTTVVVSTHDPQLAARFPERWDLTDGVLVPPAVAA